MGIDQDGVPRLAPRLPLLGINQGLCLQPDDHRLTSLGPTSSKSLACFVLHDFVAPPLEPLVPDRAIPHLAGLFVLGLSRLDLDPRGIRGHGEDHGVPAVSRLELMCGGAWHFGWLN